MGFVFYDIFLRCILLYLFASNVLLSILTLEWLNYLQATVFRILRRGECHAQCGTIAVAPAIALAVLVG